MRTIKFRGRTKEGNWVFGDLLTNHVSPEILAYKGQYEVEKETIGQYTGIVDFYGKEIYEGDVVRKVGGTFQGAVTWNSRGYYYIKEFCYFKDKEEPNCTPLGEMIKRGFEVIYNIHDNPIFLEERQ